MQNTNKAALDKDFTKDSYPVLQEYKKIANSLEEAQFKRKTNYKKLEELEKKVSCLQLLTHRSEKQSIRYQRRLQKLETTQKYATNLLKIKYQSFMDVERDTSTKHQHYITQKQQMANSRRLSQSLFDKIRTERIRRVRAEKQQLYEDSVQKNYEQEISTKRQTQKVREDELRAKDRKKRYEEFKMQQAALNYNQKVHQEYGQFLERHKYLLELREQVKNEEQVFRKTQVLGKQAAKIQSFYLTGND